MMINFKVDQDICTACGLCATDCPGDCIEVKEYATMVNEQACIRCQHCLAICPVGAISIFGLDPKNSTELIGNLPDFKAVKTLVQGRRSHRHYEWRNVDSTLVSDLVNSAAYAPTGCNAQQVLFTVINDKDKMASFREWLVAELKKVYQLPAYKDKPGFAFINAVVNGAKNNEDMLFRSAPHLIITSTSPQAACGKEDGVIALSYFELLAQSAGLGTVWDGIMYFVMKDFVPHAKEYLGIPNDYTLGYAMVFGYPTVKYPRAVQRQPMRVNYL